MGRRLANAAGEDAAAAQHGLKFGHKAPQTVLPSGLVSVLSEPRRWMWKGYHPAHDGPTRLGLMSN